MSLLNASLFLVVMQFCYSAVAQGAVIVDAFGPNSTFDSGRYVMTTIDDPRGTIPGAQGIVPGYAMRFSSGPTEIQVDLVEFAMISLRGTMDVHLSIAVVDPTGRPGASIAEETLIGVLDSEPSVISWIPTSPVVLSANSNFFLSASVPEGRPPSAIGWNGGEAYGAEIVRAFLYPDGQSWGLYLFTNFTGTAFRVTGSPIPEPTTGVLIAMGLSALATRRDITNSADDPRRVHPAAMRPSGDPCTFDETSGARIAADP